MQEGDHQHQEQDASSHSRGLVTHAWPDQDCAPGKGHEHDHDHSHADDHDHHHGSGHSGLGERIASLLHLHDHDHSSLIADRAFTETRAGIRTLWLAMGLLLLTTLLQVLIVAISGSVALLADTLHNLGDALNSVPLLIAFYLARRSANRRYNYGYARAEDVAGVFIVLSIAVSAAIVFWESFQKLLNPEPLSNLGWVAAASLIGFLGNEGVALLQIRVGRRIGSAALVADGLHARTDGLTSLAVLIAVAGSWLGFPILDPIVGFVIGIAILFITRDAARSIWYRLMDAVEPELLDQGEKVVEAQEGVLALRRLRLRWLGHNLHAEATILVDPELTTIESHAVAERVRHSLYHEIDRLSEVLVHVDPGPADTDHMVGSQRPDDAPASEHSDAFHGETAHHESLPEQLQ